MIRRLIAVAAVVFIVLLSLSLSPVRAAGLPRVVAAPPPINLDDANYGVWHEYAEFDLKAADPATAVYIVRIVNGTISIYSLDFKLKASLNDPSFWEKVNSTGADIRFFNQSDELYFKILDWNALTHKATIAVKLTAGSTMLCMAYNNSNATASTYNNATVVFTKFWTSLASWTNGITSGGYSINYVAYFDGAAAATSVTLENCAVLVDYAWVNGGVSIIMNSTSPALFTNVQGYNYITNGTIRVGATTLATNATTFTGGLVSAIFAGGKEELYENFEKTVSVQDSTYSTLGALILYAPGTTSFKIRSVAVVPYADPAMFIYYSYINVEVINENTFTELTTPLNYTVYSPDFVLLGHGVIDGSGTISVVYNGTVYVHFSNGSITRCYVVDANPLINASLTAYFPTQDVVVLTIQFNDVTGEFTPANSIVIIKRYNEIVDEQKLNALYTTTHYLVANTPYTISITNGNETRELGYISVAYSQTIQLVIGNALNVQEYPYVGVAFNISTSNGTITVTYKTVKGTTTSAEVVITNSTGAVVYNTTLTTPEGRVVYLINNTNETYYVTFKAKNSFEPVDYRTVVTPSSAQFEPVLPVVAGGSTLAINAKQLPLWARLLFFGGLGIFVALLFRRQFVAIGLTMSLAMLTVFTLMGVLPLSKNVVWVLILITMLAWFVWWRERR